MRRLSDLYRQRRSIAVKFGGWQTLYTLGYCCHPNNSVQRCLQLRTYFQGLVSWLYHGIPNSISRFRILVISVMFLFSIQPSFGASIVKTGAQCSYLFDHKAGTLESQCKLGVNLTVDDAFPDRGNIFLLPIGVPLQQLCLLPTKPDERQVLSDLIGLFDGCSRGLRCRPKVNELPIGDFFNRDLTDLQISAATTFFCPELPSRSGADDVFLLSGDDILIVRSLSTTARFSFLQTYEFIKE